MLTAALKEHQAQQAQAKRDLGMRHRKDIQCLFFFFAQSLEQRLIL